MGYKHPLFFVSWSVLLLSQFMKVNDYIKTSCSDYRIGVEGKAIRSFFIFKEYLHEGNKYINCLSIVSSVGYDYCGTILNDS